MTTVEQQPWVSSAVDSTVSVYSGQVLGPAVGSGATRSPDILPTAGETADAASAPDAAARPLTRGRSEEPVVTAAAAAKADGKSAKRTRGRAE